MQSDIDLLAYMVRWRYMTAPQVVASGPMAGLSLASAYKRLGRLQGMGLVVQHRPLTDTYALWIPTLAAYDLVESPLYPEIQVVLGSLRHTLAVTDVAALYERAGHIEPFSS